MAADVAAIGRRALFETSSWSLVASRSAGLIARNFIAIFLICDDYIIIMPAPLAADSTIRSWMRHYRHESISSAKMHICPRWKIGQIPSRRKMECAYLLEVQSDRMHKFRSNST